MLFETHIPNKTLQATVANMVYHKGYAPEHSKERFLPDGTTNLVFDLQDGPKHIYDNDSLTVKQPCTEAWFSGMQTRYLTISSGKDAEMLVCTFSAGGALPYVQRSLYDFKDKVVHARSVFGDTVMDLRNRLREPCDPQEKFELVEQWLSARATDDTFSQKVISPFIRLIQRSPEQIDLNHAARQSGYSQKQFIHLFKKYVGLTPKQYHRIVRFNEILNRIHGKQKMEWAHVASACGYFDQAHFIRDFQAFSGLNPTTYISDQGDWQHYVPVK